VIPEKTGCYTDKRVEVSVTTGFLWNYLANDYEKREKDLICNFKAMGCRMSQKLHVLHSHVNIFKGKMGHYSEEQGERRHERFGKALPRPKV